MNRRSVFSASAIAVFGLAVMTGGAVGQQKSLKEQLVGTWSFASAITTRPDGSKVETFGPNPGGLRRLASRAGIDRSTAYCPRS